MTTNLQVGDRFPNFELPNHQNERVTLSQFTQAGLMDQKLGFLDGYPLILVFYRGFFARAIVNCRYLTWGALPEMNKERRSPNHTSIHSSVYCSHHLCNAAKDTQRGEEK